MRISYLKERTGETVDLNELLLNNSMALNNTNDLDILIEKIGNAKYVLLGEASHGTHEYYTLRAKITKKLIEKKGFSFVAVEGDWPDCYRVNRYVKNYPEAGNNAFDVLHTFNRWPTWMWANWEMVALTEWLRKHNNKVSSSDKIGFYGLDVYSLWESLDAIINYTGEKDLRTKRAAMDVLKCFEPYSDGEGASYARASQTMSSICQEEVVELLCHIRKDTNLYAADPETKLNSEQNAHIIVNAEKYYRQMVQPGPDSWNTRDHHMVETLNRLMKFHGPDAKAIIWEHNTHIGDARATDMSQNGMVNVGQLLNEQNNKQDVFSIGFGSFKGTVIASREWGGPMYSVNVPKAKPGSWEHLMHQLGTQSRIVFMTDEMKKEIGQKELEHRAIGVVYIPEYERFGNYVPSLIPHRYEAFIFIDETTALHSLHIKPDGRQMPETFPFGM